MTLLGRSFGCLVLFGFISCSQPIATVKAIAFPCISITEYDKVSGLVSITADRNLSIPSYGGWLRPVASSGSPYTTGFWISYRFNNKIPLKILDTALIYTKLNADERRYTSKRLENVEVFFQEVETINEQHLATNVANGIGLLASLALGGNSNYRPAPNHAPATDVNGYT
jgi:hypothetical protein